MSIASNLAAIRQKLPEQVKLVAVSKQRSPEEISEAYDAGQRIFGENRAPELAAKHPVLPPGILWHFVGHLQTNKVKIIAPFVSMIHSIDSLKLLAEVNKEACKNNRVIDCLLQFHIAREETKYGLSQAEAEDILRSEQTREMRNVRICGVMGMGSFIDDTESVRLEFRELHAIFTFLKEHYFSASPEFAEISMGMTQDYPVAIEEGSTLIRIGTAVFG